MFFVYDGSRKKATKLLLDNNFGASPVTALSLRKLTKNATRSIRVRRSSDNTEQDIGFSGNDLDTSSLTSFVGTENLIKYSEDFATTWTAVEVSSTINGSTADGLAASDIKASNTGTLSRYILQSISKATSSTTYRVSVEAKVGTINYLTFRIDAGGANGVYANFNLTTGATEQSGTSGTGWSVVNTSSTSLGSGWYRLYVTVTTASEATMRLILCAANSATPGFSLPSFSATQNDILLSMSGVQITTGSSSVAYNKTTVGAGGNGFVTTWYDQYESLNATQPTAANQPKIVAAGVIGTEASGIPKIVYSADQWLTAGTTSSFNFLHQSGNGGSVFVAANSGNSSNPNAAYVLIDSGGAASVNTGYCVFLDDRSGVGRNNAIVSTIGRNVSLQYTSLNAQFDVVVPQTIQLYSDIVQAGNASASERSALRVNSGSVIKTNVLTNAPSAGNATSAMLIGKDVGGALKFVGSIDEVIIFPSTLSDDNRIKIEKDIMKYHSIA